MKFWPEKRLVFVGFYKSSKLDVVRVMDSIIFAGQNTHHDWIAMGSC